MKLHESTSLLVKFSEQVGSFLSSKLIEESCKAKLLHCAALFPSTLDVSCFGYECNLQGNEYWGDLLFRLDLHTQSLSAFQEPLFLHFAKENAQWENLLLFFDEWTKKELFIERGIHGIWLEMDAGSSSDWPPKPNLFLETDMQHELFYETIDEAWFGLKQKRLSRETLAILRRCAADHFAVFGIGFMLARPLDAVRICIRSKDLINTSTLHDYLNSLGHFGLDDSLIAFLTRMRPYLDYLYLDVDAADHPYPKIGLTCYIEEKDFSASRRRWDQFLIFLLSEGLADEERQLALRSWFGYQYASFFSQDILLRDINHVKLVYTPEKPLRAKMYLRVRHFENNL